MNIWENTVLTTKGIALLSKLIQGNTLSITKAVSGADYVTPGTLQSQTAITNPKQTLTFRSFSFPEEGKSEIICLLTNEGLTEGYTVKQIGVYAMDPDEGEVLFFITQATYQNSGTNVPAESEAPGFSAEWAFTFPYGQADTVAVTVNPSNTVTQAIMKTYVAEAITSGRTMKGDIDMGGNKVTNVAEPTQRSDVATKGFVEDFSIEGSTYVAVDENHDGNIVLRPYVADEDELQYADHIKNKKNPHGITTEQIGAVPLAGGSMIGALKTAGLVLKIGIDYDKELPKDAEDGTLFFKVVD